METMEKSYDHIATEKDWYRRWEESGLFQADNQSNKPPFSLILPPPNVTGQLHIGHAFTNTLPDIIVRRKKMQGFNVLWLPGVDHAGIATQMVVERWLKQERNQTKEDLGREKFLQLVWDWKERSQQAIVGQIKKLGLSLDWTRMKFTFSEEMQRAVRRIFVQLHREGLIYQGVYMVNRCPSCKTVLSDLEVEHKEVQGQLTTIRYPLKGRKGKFIAVATTRPETMLGDTAVAVNPKDRRYRNLIGATVILPIADREIPIIGDDRVEKGFGTGAVKVTPAHDPFDYQLAQAHDLPSVRVIDETGRMTGPIPDRYIGQDRFTCRRALLAELRQLGAIVKEEPYQHNIGHCHRCGTVVEPLVSKQWFLKMKDLAEPAVQAVRSKQTVFIPDKWAKVYFNWLENIQDWCISRQLWWGHRIPAFTCRSCQEVTVSEVPLHECPRCHSQEVSQDEDVLDTWFSSALWPFITLGWQDNGADYRVFYPTSIMATAFDIIFFWVARMIMMGVHFCHDVPFREVLINGLIRDEKGQKMSKTRNNVIDPLAIIAEYGADALRFTMAIQAAPGMDIALSVSRVKGYKAFTNKIWNASRFVLMNLKGDEDSPIEYRELGVTDRWILQRLNQTVLKLNELFDSYRIYEAADLLYHFVWDEYCDWYVEFSKNDLDHPSSRRVLKKTLLRILQLLHPFMPFISEEIYQRLGQEKPFLVQTEFPQFTPDWHFPAEFAAVELLKRVIAETRRVRTENHIDPAKRIAVYLRCDDAGERESVAAQLKYFNFLTRSSRTEMVADFTGLPKGFKGVSGSWEILLPFDSDADLQHERQRLSAELKKLDTQIDLMEGKLAHGDFVTKAPPEVVANFKKDLQDRIGRKNKLQKTITDLS